jgi:hypothetical protein
MTYTEKKGLSGFNDATLYAYKSCKIGARRRDGSDRQKGVLKLLRFFASAMGVHRHEVRENQCNHQESGSIL